MKYVDNLLEVDPKDIRHKERTAPIQAILKINNPSIAHKEAPVLVVFEDGVVVNYTIEGRVSPTDDNRHFIFKPKKVKKLKPLHVVLAEDGEYKVRDDGWVYMRYSRTGILPGMFPYFGTTNMPSQYSWDEKWIEEVDEVGV